MNPDGNLSGRILNTYGFDALYVRYKSVPCSLLMRGAQDQERIDKDHGHWLMDLLLKCGGSPPPDKSGGYVLASLTGLQGIRDSA